MKYKEQKELVDGLRALADFFEQHIEVPTPYSIHVSGSVSKYDENSEYDEDSTKEAMIGIARSMKPVEKHYDSSDLNLVKKFSGMVKLSYYCKRETVCTKVVTGTREIEEVVYVPPVKTGKMVSQDIVEWQCDPLLG